MSSPYGMLVCADCDQYVDDLCIQHEEICTQCCEELEHEIQHIV